MPRRGEHCADQGGGEMKWGSEGGPGHGGPEKEEVTNEAGRKGEVLEGPLVICV